jgi:hypothetical protein
VIANLIMAPTNTKGSVAEAAEEAKKEKKKKQKESEKVKTDKQKQLPKGFASNSLQKRSWDDDEDLKTGSRRSKKGGKANDCDNDGGKGKSEKARMAAAMEDMGKAANRRSQLSGSIAALEKEKEIV